MPRGRRDHAVDREPVPVLHQDVPLVTELRRVTLTLPKEPRFRVGRRGVRVITAALAVKVNRGVVGIGGRRARRGILVLENS
jgi:hypothetical protein